MTDPTQARVPENAAAAPTPFEVDGQTFTPEQAADMIRKGVDYSKKTMEVADLRRDYESGIQEVATMRDQFEERLAEPPAHLPAATPPTAAPSVRFEELDAISPALGEFARHTITSQQEVVGGLRELSGTLNKKIETEDAEKAAAAKQQAEVKTFNAWETSGGKSLAGYDRLKVLEYMQANGLHAGQAQVAYDATAGQVVAHARGEEDAVLRGGQAPPPMGSESEPNLGFTAPAEAPGARMSIEEMKSNDIVKAAMNDPRGPQV